MEHAVSRRAINHIWHFTRLANLGAILNHGIIPRMHLDRHATQVRFNDPHRLDGQRGASCFSIGHPNYKMFYSLRMQEPEEKWVVVACRASVLWLKDCAFCHENAASNSVTCIPIEARRGVQAFERMFDPVEGKPSRAAIALPDYCPTNPQAEVLVFGTVEPEFIVGAVCQDTVTVDELTARHPQFRFIYHRAHFSPRSDYAYWR